MTGVSKINLWSKQLTTTTSDDNNITSPIRVRREDPLLPWAWKEALDKQTWALLVCHWHWVHFLTKTHPSFVAFFFFFTPLSWENLPELIHRSQHMNFQSGISRIFQCGSSFVNLASVACVVGKGNVNRIWSLGQGIASLISKKDFKNRAHLARSMSVMFLWFEVCPPHQTTKKVQEGMDICCSHAFCPRGQKKGKERTQCGVKEQGKERNGSHQ